MARAAQTERDFPGSIRGVTDAVFGRWPAWPWSVLALIAAGGVAGALVAPALRAAGAATPAALGTAACAGYGIVIAALVALLPRAWALLSLQRAVVRRPSGLDASWWPLELLAAALRSTPALRRTPEEFNAAVSAAVGQARTILSDRLWPEWTAAFVAPVLGLMTAWQNGARVQLRMQGADAPGQVFPAFIAQVSPPMVATIAASLVLIVAVVAIDQWTKGLLLRWAGVVEAADGGHPLVLERLSITAPIQPDAREQIPRAAVNEPSSGSRESLPKHHLDPDELERRWRQSAPRSE